MEDNEVANHKDVFDFYYHSKLKSLSTEKVYLNGTLNYDSFIHNIFNNCISRNCEIIIFLHLLRLVGTIKKYDSFKNINMLKEKIKKNSQS